MPLIPFTVSARTARLIGQENFANADGAIAELVKNSYDADAENAIVFFHTSDSSDNDTSIYIIDNGSGMTDQTIIDYWMMIGTDNKASNVSTDRERIKTGEKGIGRFALDRLGSKAEMFTIPKDTTSGFCWQVNWEDFKIAGLGISDVKATLDGIVEFDLKSKIRGIAAIYPPLLDYVNQKDFNSGTIIKISELRDHWSLSDLTRLFNNLEILIPPKEQSDFKISLFVENSETEFGELKGAFYDDFDYRVSTSYLADEKKTFVVEITRNELNLPKVEDKFLEVFEPPQMKSYPYDLETFKKGTFTLQLTIDDLIKGYSENQPLYILDKIGKFEFVFYFLKLTRSDSRSEGDFEKFPYRDFNSTSRRNWLRKFGGIKIYRDNFRVRPYGENGQDWLNLGERQSQSPQGAGQRLGAYRIGPNQISGTVKISRLTNLSFIDKSGREGIQENEVFELFKKILIGAINQFEKDRNLVMFSFAEFYKKKKQEETAKAEAEELARKILQQQQEKENGQEKNESTSTDENKTETSGGTPSENEVTLAKGFKAIEEDVQRKDDEIRLLRSLSGTGLIVASVAHELRSIRHLLINRTDDVRNALEKLIPKATLTHLASFENPITMLNHMREQDVQIKHWLDFALSALQKDRRTRRNIDIKAYFENYVTIWQGAASRRQVSITQNPISKEDIVLRAFTIDLDTIFNNLLINSFESFKRRKDHKPRNVSIEYAKNNSTVEILFRDNGAGLSKSYEKNPYEIFLPFETTKVDKKGEKIGSGMGMYLTKTIVDDYSGDVQIVPNADGFTLKILFPLRKDQL